MEVPNTVLPVEAAWRLQPGCVREMYPRFQVEERHHLTRLRLLLGCAQVTLPEHREEARYPLIHHHRDALRYPRDLGERLQPAPLLLVCYQTDASYTSTKLFRCITSSARLKPSLCSICEVWHPAMRASSSLL